jgi:hypothetical protein
MNTIKLSDFPVRIQKSFFDFDYDRIFIQLLINHILENLPDEKKEVSAWKNPFE